MSDLPLTAGDNRLPVLTVEIAEARTMSNIFDLAAWKKTRQARAHKARNANASYICAQAVADLEDLGASHDEIVEWLRGDR